MIAELTEALARLEQDGETAIAAAARRELVDLIASDAAQAAEIERLRTALEQVRSSLARSRTVGVVNSADLVVEAEYIAARALAGQDGG